jgi:hypothetical protein
MDWDQMAGDDRIRFCNLCQRNVYNLVQLSRPEIDQIWKDEPERVCARMVRNESGQLVTRENVNEGKLRKYQFSTLFLFMLMTAAAPLAAISPTVYRATKGWLNSWLGDTATQNANTVSTVIAGEILMGDICEDFPDDSNSL